MKPVQHPILIAVVAVLFGGLFASCASQQAGLPPGGIELAISRSGRWTTFTVQPPQLFGARGMVEVRNGKLNGAVDGRPLHLVVTDREMTGVAGGQVALDVVSAEGKTEVSGVWNDERIHIEVTPESLRGTITGVGLGHCQYVLDRVESNGTRVGSSICRGMPADTRLDFSNQLGKWFSKHEQVALLLVLLAAPPASPTD